MKVRKAIFNLNFIEWQRQLSGKQEGTMRDKTPNSCNTGIPSFIQ